MEGKNPPLSGIRVLDFSRVLTGPFCSMVLGDLGAEVIKVELPGVGDETREWPPMNKGISSYYLMINRNKKSITLDLKDIDAREALYSIVRKTDVILENFRPGVTRRLGVDYETIKELKPDIVYCSISSFGQTGPYRLFPGYDMIVQGMSGLMSVTGYPDRPPVRSGVAIADIGSAIWAALSIVVALYQLKATGVGQYIDVSMLDCMVSWLTSFAGNYWTTGNTPTRIGNSHPGIVPYRDFLCGDGRYILIAGNNDRLFSRLCQTIGLEELMNDPRFSTAASRNENRDLLMPLVEEKFLSRGRDEWLSLLRNRNFPCGPINSVEEILNDQQVNYRGMVSEVNHPVIGLMKQLGFPIKSTLYEANISMHPPLLGEHTEEILNEVADYPQKKISFLKKKGVI